MSQRKPRTLSSSDAEKYNTTSYHHEDVSSSSQRTESIDEELAIHYTKYPNRWSRIREVLREPVAEFFGVMILIIFGAGVDCQVVLSGNTGVASSPTVLCIIP
ncbi:hypothetical protein K466DRAFT_586474 [Polyporus arcularius HHB13444]|uniref:Uncharacterized protein n=1 Tax=Polyporus arcularius HHB13444 TaxID=1314778 RepID=A0A5C3PMX6_9APHY|nr:hypothetical protein K466DRAFT_586474 [Polyporus arcularius HHB13444]